VWSSGSGGGALGRHQEKMSYLWRLLKIVKDSEGLSGFKDTKSPKDLSKFWFQSGKSFKDLCATFNNL
jgi:hypothetical protein